MKTYLVLFVVFSTSYADDFFEIGNNLFTTDIYQKVAKNDNGNFLLSPFSLEIALSFLQSGSNNESAEEIRNSLHLPNDQSKIENALQALLPQLEENDLYNLHLANKIYIKKDFPIKKEFQEIANRVYQTSAENIDFSKSDEAAKKINSLVEEKTNNKIKNLISASHLNDHTRMILINALYFNANWSIPFPESATKKEDFYKTPSEAIKVDTLHHKKKKFFYYQCPHLDAEFLELPYKGEAVMVIVLPNDKNGLSKLEKKLEQVFLPQHELQEQLLNVFLPKFKLETSVDFEAILKELGVVRIFDKEKADLTGIGGKKGDLEVSKVVQKTFIDVSEGGVEAAAATSTVIFQPPRPSLPPLVKDFRADHPFIFYIKIKNVIAFVGRVTDPSKF